MNIRAVSLLLRAVRISGPASEKAGGRTEGGTTM